MSVTWRNRGLCPVALERREREQGFTLLETLVALFLLVIISAALYSSYFTVIKARDAASGRAEEQRELAATLDQLRREISGAFFIRGRDRLHFVVEDRDQFGKPASVLDFSMVAPPRSDSRSSSDLIRVRYRLVEKEGKPVLEREARELYADLDPRPYPQMRGIQGFLVECFDGGKWVRSWDTELNFTMPKRVRITITVSEGGQPVTFSATASPRASGP